MLVRIALRLCAIEALKGRTHVGDNVLDSELGALDIGADGAIRTDQDKPFLTVYTEASKAAGGVELRALHASGELDLVFEFGFAAAMTQTNEDGESEIVGIGIPATDAAIELYLDLVGRQIVDALTDPTNEWAELWRSLSSGIVKVEHRRTGDGERVGKIAAHQIVVTLAALPDPIRSEPIKPTSAWAKLLTKMEAAGHAFLPKMVEMLGDPSGVLDRQMKGRRFGLTIEELRAMLDIAVPPGEATEPDITTVTSEQVPTS